MKKLRTTIIVFSFFLLIGELVIVWQLRKIRPQLKEEIISVQTTKLEGETYVCGTIGENNRDKESLYCRGFSDGYSWATLQMRLNP